MSPPGGTEHPNVSSDHMSMILCRMFSLQDVLCQSFIFRDHYSLEAVKLIKSIRYSKCWALRVKSSGDWDTSLLKNETWNSTPIQRKFCRNTLKVLERMLRRLLNKCSKFQLKRELQLPKSFNFHFSLFLISWLLRHKNLNSHQIILNTALQPWIVAWFQAGQTCIEWRERVKIPLSSYDKVTNTGVRKAPTLSGIGLTVGIELHKGVLYNQETVTIVVRLERFKQISKSVEKQTIWLTFLRFHMQEEQSSKEIITHIWAIWAKALNLLVIGPIVKHHMTPLAPLSNSIIEKLIKISKKYTVAKCPNTIIMQYKVLLVLQWTQACEDSVIIHKLSV